MISSCVNADAGCFMRATSLALKTLGAFGRRVAF
jgi:hypothetical protein